MIEALLKRPRHVPSELARARRAVPDGPFTRWLLSQPVPRELMFDILRASSKYDRASLVADAHAAHIRALRRHGRRSDAQMFSGSRHSWSGRVSTDVAVNAPTVVAANADPWSADPWSRRVPTVVVDAEQFQSLLEQVRELRRLANELTRLEERVDANGHAGMH